MTVKSDSKKRTPEAQLRAYIDKLDPKNQKLFRSVRAAVRKRFPTANELAYDYGHALVIGYSQADRGIDSIVAIRASATGVSLYFSQGPQLPDPKRLLRGSGKQTRFIQVEAASQLAHLPDVEATATPLRLIRRGFPSAIQREGQSHHQVGWCEEAATPEAVEVTLSRIGLACTQITDAGLVHLKALINLSSLDLLGTRVSDAGVKEQQQALPSLKIAR